LRGTLWPATSSRRPDLDRRISTVVVEPLLIGLPRLDGLEDVPVPGAAAVLPCSAFLILFRRSGSVHRSSAVALISMPGVRSRTEGAWWSLNELLQALSARLVAEPFHGLDHGAVGLDGEHHAALSQLAVHEQRAGTAVPRVAPMWLRSVEVGHG